MGRGGGVVNTNKEYGINSELIQLLVFIKSNRRPNDVVRVESKDNFTHIQRQKIQQKFAQSEVLIYR